MDEYEDISPAIPPEADVQWTLNMDDPDNIFVNVYHFEVCEANRGEGIGSDVVGSLIASAKSHPDVTQLSISMQVPDENEAAAKNIYTERFEFDIVEYPVEHRRYDNDLLKATMFGLDSDN